MNFKIPLFIFLLVTASATPVRKDQRLLSFMIVWNVGQGQWATFATAESCHHFDMGGEFNPQRKVARVCADVMNYIYLSHWDWDHVSFVEKSGRKLRQRCLALPPEGTASARKMAAIKKISVCTEQNPLAFQKLTSFSKTEKLKSNDASHVLLVAGRYLLPGDSGTQQEKRWGQNRAILKTKWLLLGHHGSRTSTSERLLQRLPRLQIAIASARNRRYGHPHLEVVASLRRKQIPLLKTEDWGHLWFEHRP